ncbi:Centromere/kinetochore Zw10-domain-containing protein [Cytidiella melzeri]|nr:Centromere/kinetochore Zw10-domain-containing protein [Cytidiella melzeri]
MAFPVPTHLPRKKNADVSTRLLSEISETTFKSLSQEVASKWITELDVAIRQTKDEIHKRINSELPAFDQQLSSSKYVQERLNTLETNVDKLSATLTHPESGLVPNLISTLTRHAALAQELADAEVMHQVMSHLAHCKREMQTLASLVGQGRLPDAVALCVSIDHLLATSPPPLPATAVMHDLQRRFRALKDQTEEQLHEAYSRSIVVTANELLIRPSVQVRASETVLSLSDILSSLSSGSLTSLVNTLRRDLTSHYIDRLLSQAATVEQSSVRHLAGVSEVKLTVFPSPPNEEQLTSRLESVSVVLRFLNDKLFPHFPSQAKLATFLYRPLTSGVLEKLLVPALPSSVTALPAFLSLMQRAVKFEGQFMHGLLEAGHDQKEIKTWADGVAGHYERKRRVELLERARVIILHEDKDGVSFRAERATIMQTAPVRTKASQPDRTTSPEDTAWGFDGDADVDASPTTDEDGWGLDDDDVDADNPSAAVEPEPEPTKGAHGDPGDAWGWNEDDQEAEALNGDGEETLDSSAWDDPWGDVSESTPASTVPSKLAKTASRLEKLSNKGKAKKSSPPIYSPIPLAPPPPTPAMPALSTKKQAVNPIQPVTENESYLVSGHMKELLSLVEAILREAAELTSSGVLSPYIMGASQVGGTIGSTAASVLDLFRALYPVHATSKLATSPKWPILFSNNCIWLGSEVRRVIHSGHAADLTAQKLIECADRLEVVGELCFEEAVDDQCQKVDEILNDAEGFANTTDQDCYDDCEAAVNQVLQHIRGFSQTFKLVLPKSKYYEAMGAAVDVALSRILSDVLSLSDITDEESHKLSELCRIMNSLEGLFVENPNLPSFVVEYVPSWFKFSYLSELLEASIADISYLFEEGALVDFSVDELVNLVRALFADTPLRTNTINKIMQGHPLQS